MTRPIFQGCNPATGEVLEQHAGHTDDAAAAIASVVHESWLGWRTTSFDERAGVLRRVAHLLRERVDRYARRMADEMGKPLRGGRDEIEKCAWACEFYAENGRMLLSAEEVDTEATRSRIVFRPLGVVLGIMPWNFPFWQVFRYVAPNLMAGNACLLKHASNVPGCALDIEEVLRDAALPSSVFRTLLVGSGQVPALIAHPRVAAVTLTGSVSAGREVARGAGEHVKPSVLELGGSDPYVVLEDADLDKAVQACVTSRLLNSGQSCIAAKRFIVVDAVYEAFLGRFVYEMGRRVVGNPLREDTEVGPLARHDLRDGLHEQVQGTLDAGARCLLGGAIPEGPGAFYPPTVLADVPTDSPGAIEELFGPVACVFRAHDEDHAIRIANSTSFGLGASVFTADLERGRRIAEDRLEAGCCFVNSFVRSDPRLPFGGIKESGYGRELGLAGIRSFVNQKTVVVG